MGSLHLPTTTSFLETPSASATFLVAMRAERQLV
jgi:hypothetical protein